MTVHSRLHNVQRALGATIIAPSCSTADSFIINTTVIMMDRDSSVGTATGYGLDGPRIETR
jgi:hypothetical protein